MIFFVSIFSTLFEIMHFIFYDTFRAFLDVFGHYLTGLVLANIIYRDKDIIFRVGIAFMAFLPDFDFLLQVIGLVRHGDIFHGPLILIFVFVFGIFFYKKPLYNKNFGKLLIFASLCVIFHLILDFAYNYFLQIGYLIIIGVSYFVWARVFLKNK